MRCQGKIRRSQSIASSKLRQTKKDDACAGSGNASEGILIDLPLIPTPDQCRVRSAEGYEGSPP